MYIHSKRVRSYAHILVPIYISTLKVTKYFKYYTWKL